MECLLYFDGCVSEIVVERIFVLFFINGIWDLANQQRRCLSRVCSSYSLSSQEPAHIEYAWKAMEILEFNYPLECERERRSTILLEIENCACFESVFFFSLWSCFFVRLFVWKYNGKMQFSDWLESFGCVIQQTIVAILKIPGIFI